MYNALNECGSDFCHNILSSHELHEGYCNECNYAFNPKQRQWAQELPDIYFQKIVLLDGTETTVLKMAEQLLDGKIIAIFGWFAVTTQGIECLSHEYSIGKAQLDIENWIEHMSEKSWVNLTDFSDALKFAKNRSESSEP